MLHREMIRLKVKVNKFYGSLPHGMGFAQKPPHQA
jgi:hypothetical protein